tara:strand:- start:1132 stop:1632 length:501 start_codon:yes stop_codon:yes gene_type:complete
MNNNCASHIKEEQNQQMYDRNIPSSMLQPYLSVRPVMTKYSYLPVVDPRSPIKTKLTEQPTYNVHNTFNPGDKPSPWSGFASNVNLESELRNQVYALQRCSQSVYVPTSTSDLYSTKFQPKPTVNQSPHTLLFTEQTFNCFNPNPNETKLGNDFFNNNTRNQVKDL